jgi:hypothetical protein
MKRALFIFAVVIVGLTGCDDQPGTSTIEFHPQWTFEDDHVEIYLDDAMLVMDQKVKTLQVLGVDPNAIKAIPTFSGEHSIRVVINHGSSQLKTIVSVNSDLYIGVNYNSKTGEISIHQSSKAFTYM